MSERPEVSYSVFRGGFREGAEIPPHWDDLPPWVRDAIRVGYYQGKVDAATKEQEITENQIKHMVDRFLCWKIPEDFSPDCGISFKKTHSEQGPFGIQKYEPIGTNLFDGAQASAMVRHIIKDFPAAP